MSLVTLGTQHIYLAHFTAAVNLGAFSSNTIHFIYEELTAVRQYDAYIMLFYN
jgi:hypothetical protein